MTSPFSTDNPLPLHLQPLAQSSDPFTVFSHWSTSPCPPTLFKTSFSTMSYYNNTILNDSMSILLRKISSRQYYSFYKVPYRAILNFITSLESIQEQQVTPLVENDNQQQIYRWVRNYLLLPSVIVDYTDWELHKSFEVRILLKSSFTAIHDNFVVPKTSLQRYLNVIFLQKNCSSLNYLWYLATRRNPDSTS